MKRNTSRLLLTHDSFIESTTIPDKDDENKQIKKRNPCIHGNGGPALSSTLLTVLFYTALLFIIEQLTRMFIAQYAHLDKEVLGNERNRHILARHIAVDFFPLLACAYLAIVNRHACSELISHGIAHLQGKKEQLDSSSMHGDGYEERVFKYHPGAQRLLMIFLFIKLRICMIQLFGVMGLSLFCIISLPDWLLGAACSQDVVTSMHYFTLVSQKLVQQYSVYLPTLILSSVLSV